ncbi:hypothetical protein ABPG72_007733 [Tetrahymena utriculariae]
MSQYLEQKNSLLKFTKYSSCAIKAIQLNIKRQTLNWKIPILKKKQLKRNKNVYPYLKKILQIDSMQLFTNRIKIKFIYSKRLIILISLLANIRKYIDNQLSTNNNNQLNQTLIKSFAKMYKLKQFQKIHKLFIILSCFNKNLQIQNIQHNLINQSNFLRLNIFTQFNTFYIKNTVFYKLLSLFCQYSLLLNIYCKICLMIIWSIKLKVIHYPESKQIKILIVHFKCLYQFSKIFMN